MQVAYFIAKRLLGRRGTQAEQRSGGISLLLGLSVLGVAMSLLIVLLSLSIIQGFKREVGQVAYSQTGQVCLYPWGGSWQSTHQTMAVSPQLLTFLEAEDEVQEVFPLIQQMAILKTEEDFLGIPIYGVEAGRSYSFFEEALSLGEMPHFDARDSVANPIVLPSKVVERMGLNLGDKVRLYYSDEKVKVRAYQLVGVYNSHGVEQMPALCSAEGLRRWAGLPLGSYSRVLMMLKPSASGAEFAESLISKLSGREDIIGNNLYAIATAEEMLPDIFQWLSLLDSNVVFLMVMMLIVGAFTMITGLIIVVLDKTRQIGILKAIGADDLQIRRVFVWIAMRLILYGMLWGNALALLLVGVQKFWRIVPLDPRNYFMDAVPVVLDLPLWLGVNVGVFVLILLAILAPTYIISQIKPADIMRID